MTRQEKRKAFIEAVANFMTTGVGTKSIHLEMGMEYAKAWAAICQSIGFNGYGTKEEAIKTLEEIL